MLTSDMLTPDMLTWIRHANREHRTDMGWVQNLFLMLKLRFDHLSFEQ